MLLLSKSKVPAPTHCLRCWAGQMTWSNPGTESSQNQKISISYEFLPHQVHNHLFHTLSLRSLCCKQTRSLSRWYPEATVSHGRCALNPSKSSTRCPHVFVFGLKTERPFCLFAHFCVCLITVVWVSGWGGVLMTFWPTPTLIWCYASPCSHNWCYRDDGVGCGGVEAKQKILSERFLLHFTIAVGTEANTCLLRCLLRWRLRHIAFSYRENDFVGKNKRHAGKLFLVHTGIPDVCWGMFKKYPLSCQRAEQTTTFWMDWYGNRFAHGNGNGHQML